MLPCRRSSGRTINRKRVGRMHHSGDAGCGGDLRRQAERQLRVEDCDIGQNNRARYTAFLFFADGDDGRRRDFGAGARHDIRETVNQWLSRFGLDTAKLLGISEVNRLREERDESAGYPLGTPLDAHQVTSHSNA